MSPEIAKLLLAAILDNTLNFNAEITTDRDKKAARKLAEIAKVDFDNFVAWYFTEVGKTVLQDLETSMRQDQKIITIPNTKTKFNFYQLTLWSAKKILETEDKIRQAAQDNSEKFLVSIIDISARQNYLLTNSKVIREYFESLLNLKWHEPWLISDRLYLRKEIIRKMLEN